MGCSATWKADGQFFNNTSQQPLEAEMQAARPQEFLVVHEAVVVLPRRHGAQSLREAMDDSKKLLESLQSERPGQQRGAARPPPAR